jgi:hypothetical protein
MSVRERLSTPMNAERYQRGSQFCYLLRFVDNCRATAKVTARKKTGPAKKSGPVISAKRPTVYAGVKDPIPRKSIIPSLFSLAAPRKRKKPPRWGRLFPLYSKTPS